MTMKTDVMEEAARIVAAGFAKQKGLALSVVGEDPITAALGWKNGTIPSGTQVFVGYILGKLNVSDGSFSVYAFTMDSIQYAYGSVLPKAAPAPGASDSVSILSYALDVAAAMTCDALVFVCPAGTLACEQVTFGSGARIVGLKWTDWQALALSAYKIFTGMLTISPKPDPATIMTFSIGKG